MIAPTIIRTVNHSVKCQDTKLKMELSDRLLLVDGQLPMQLVPHLAGGWWLPNDNSITLVFLSNTSPFDPQEVTVLLCVCFSPVSLQVGELSTHS